MKKYIVVMVFIFISIFSYAEIVDINMGVETGCRHVFPDYENTIISIGVNNTVFIGKTLGLVASLSVYQTVYGSNYEVLINDGLDSLGNSLLLGLGYKIKGENLDTILVLGFNELTIFSSNGSYGVGGPSYGIGLKVLNNINLKKSCSLSVPLAIGYDYSEYAKESELPYNQIWCTISAGLNFDI